MRNVVRSFEDFFFGLDKATAFQNRESEGRVARGRSGRGCQPLVVTLADGILCRKEGNDIIQRRLANQTHILTN